MRPKADNPNGFWERYDVVSINDEILALSGGAWCRVGTLNLSGLDGEARAQIDRRIAEVIADLETRHPWMLKDPRFSLTLPLWAPHLTDPAAVLVQRNPLEVASSLHKRNGIPLYVGLALWEAYTRAALKATSDMPRILVRYDEILTEPGAFASDLLNKLQEAGVDGLAAPKASASKHLVDSNLYRETWPEQSLPEYLNAAQLCLWEAITNGSIVDEPGLYEISVAARRALQDFTEIEVRLESLKRSRDQARDRQRDELTEERTEHLYHIRLLDEWMRQLLEDIEASFSSIAWRIGSLITRGAGVVMLKGNPGSAQDHVEQLAAEYRAWRADKLSDLGLERTILPGSTDMEAVRKQSSIGRLIIVMLRNPGKTVHLLNPERVWNFFVTCFKQPAHIRREIVKEYLTIYGLHKELESKNRQGIKPWNNEKIDFPGIAVPEVSVIVPVFNNFDITMSCLAALQENSHNVGYEVILADDASTDDRIARIDTYCENIKVVRAETNRGFVENCNAAVGQAKGRYVLLLNNDAFVEKGCLRALLDTAEADDSVGIVGPKIVYPDDRLQEAGGIIWRDGSAWNYGRGDDPARSEYNYVREVDYISGAALLVRRDFWDQVGGFDTRFAPAYYEDADLAFQARQEGCKVVYQPKAVVVHAEGMSHGTDETGDVKAHQSTNRHKFAEKWNSKLQNEHYANGDCVFLARERGQSRSTVLVVDHYVPEFDKDAGSKSTLQYLELMVRNGARVKFLPDDFYKREPYVSVLEGMGIEVLYGDHYANNWKKWWKDNSKFIDVVYLHRPHIASRYIDVFRRTPDVKRIYFGHDLHYLRLDRQYEVQQDPAIRKDADRWRRLEYKIIEKSDIVYYPSSVEVEAVRKRFPEKTVRAIPLYITESVKGSVPGFADRTGVFFVGGFRHPPNMDGVEWFTREVLPRVADRVPEMRFIIAGSRMPDEILSLSGDHVVVRGPVSEEELARLYAQVRLVVVPLRFGAGVKGKVLDAMRHRVPVVTTTVGAEGLPEPLDYLGIGDGADEFARQVIELYTNQAKWMALSAEGAEIIDRCFSAQRALEAVAEDFGLSTGQNHLPWNRPD